MDTQVILNIQFNNMKKTELSIRDFVKVPELVYDNGLEDFSNGMYQIWRLGDYDLDVCAYEELDYTEVEPIMITKAILEKLGFVEKELFKGANTFEYKTDDLLVIYSTTLWSIDMFKAKEKLAEPNTILFEAGNVIEFDLSATKILYVHQLQHLLRLVGKDFDGIELAGIYEF